MKDACLPMYPLWKLLKCLLALQWHIKACNLAWNMADHHCEISQTRDRNCHRSGMAVTVEKDSGVFNADAPWVCCRNCGECCESEMAVSQTSLYIEDAAPHIRCSSALAETSHAPLLPFRSCHIFQMHAFHPYHGNRIFHAPLTPTKSRHPQRKQLQRRHKDKQQASMT